MEAMEEVEKITLVFIPQINLNFVEIQLILLGSHGANFSQPKSPFHHSQPNDIFSPNHRPIHFSPANNFFSGHFHHRWLIGSAPTYRPIFNHENNFAAGQIFCQICQKQGHRALDCYNRMNFSYQGRHPPSQLAAMTVNSMNSQSSTNNFWLSDNGCNVHMTNELANLNLSNNYNGEETITVENEQPLNIQNTNCGKLLPHCHTFNLSKILHAQQCYKSIICS